MIAAAIADIQRDRAGRIAVAAVRLGLALMSSGVALLPWPSRANLAALHAAALSPADAVGAPAAASKSAAGAIYPPPGSVAPTTALISRPVRAGHHVPALMPSRGLPARGPGLDRSGVSAPPGRGVVLTPGPTA
nr:hypothetical protein [Micromonospora sp. DSM 115978]